ncbi:MAG TPA: dienelactone hydrolase family protein [Chitinophagaceae bacterium]|nr:dienelactone hydrolase family protein [Chitinophagaceae bacterium]
MKKIILAAFSVLLLLSACKNGDNKKEVTDSKEPKLKEESITYKVDSLNMNSFMVYDENLKGKRPLVLVIHEWWGLNDYVKMRAKKLAELGYVALAVDMYGNGQMGNDPDAAGKLAMPFYQNTEMAKRHILAAIENVKTNVLIDTSKMAIMGYCFGGAVSIGVARMGLDLKGAVSFHGNLNVVPLNKDLLKAEILVCHGNADPLVPQAEVDLFKKQMDSVGAKYIFKGYEGAMHAFTNPNATALGEKYKLPIKYDAAADTASWNEMKVFLERVLR